MLKQFFAFALLTHCVICRFTPEVRQWQEGDERQNCTNICHKECIECKEPKYCTEDQVKCGEKTPENHPDCSADDICVPSDCLCPNNPDCTLKCHIECDDDEIKCEGGTDADGCEVNDYCHPKGTGTHGLCPGWCPEECDGVSCPNPNNPSTGCPTKPTCKPKQENNQGNECPSQPCPVFCEITEIQCDGKIDHQGCKEGDTCVPKGSSNTEELCPGTCPVECGSDEILCKGQTDCDTGCVESDQCISKVKDMNGDNCPDDSASHGCPITCCDGDILCPAKTNAIGCKEKEQCTPRSKDNKKTLNCPREEGFCVLPNGGDQNSGVIKINNIDGNTIEAQEECLNQCHNVAGATGCEVIWNQGNRGCYAHTKQIDRGNNVGNHFCWVFSKCAGNNMDNYCPDHSDCPTVCQPHEVLCPIEGTEENGCDKPDVCIVQDRDQNGRLCPVHCPFECNEDEVLCTGHRTELGCEEQATCVKKARKQWGNAEGDLCPAVCPERCEHDEILCPRQFDPCDGCPTEQVCHKKHKNSNGEYCPDDSASHNCPKLCYETEVVGRPINDQVLCPVYEDAAGCKPEARCFQRSKDADDEWCPSTSVCPVQCQSNEIECSDGVDAKGCTRESLCLPKGKDGDGNTCARSCPKACAESQTFCEGSTLPNGCQGQGYCTETECTALAPSFLLSRMGSLCGSSQPPITDLTTCQTAFNSYVLTDVPHARMDSNNGYTWSDHAGGCYINMGDNPPHVYFNNGLSGTAGATDRQICTGGNDVGINIMIGTWNPPNGKTRTCVKISNTQVRCDYTNDNGAQSRTLQWDGAIVTFTFDPWYWEGNFAGDDVINWLSTSGSTTTWTRQGA